MFLFFERKDKILFSVRFKVAALYKNAFRRQDDALLWHISVVSPFMHVSFIVLISTLAVIIL